MRKWDFNEQLNAFSNNNWTNEFFESKILYPVSLQINITQAAETNSEWWKQQCWWWWWWGGWLFNFEII